MRPVLTQMGSAPSARPKTTGMPQVQIAVLGQTQSVKNHFRNTEVIMAAAEPLS